MKIKIPTDNNYFEKFIGNITLLIYGLYSFFSILDSSLLDIDFLMKSIKYGTLLIELILLSTLYFRKNISLSSFLLSIGIFSIFFISSQVTDRSYLAIYALFILLGKYCDLRSTVKTSLLSNILSLSFILCLIRAGILYDYIYHLSSGSGIAHCLGFSYYSAFPYSFFYCMVMYLYLRGSRVRLVENLILLWVNFLMHSLSPVRLTYYLGIFLILSNYLIHHLKWINLKNNAWIMFAKLSFSFGAVSTLLLMKNYKEEGYWIVLNRILSGRLGLMNKGFNLYPLKLFGNFFQMRGNSALHKTIDYFYIDSGFAYSLLGYGLIFTGLVVFLYSSIFVYACVKNDRSLFVWLLVVLIFTMINNTWVNLNINPILMFSLPSLIELFKNKRELKKKSKEAKCYKGKNYPILQI